MLPASDHSLRATRRTQACAAALRAIIKALPEGDDWFELRHGAPYSLSAHLHDSNGVHFSTSTTSMVNGLRTREWIMHADGGGYLITPQGHEAARSSIAHEQGETQ